MGSMGKLIKDVRQKKGLSQEELAHAINSTKSAISRYESGKRQPDYDQIKRIATALDVEWLDLVPEGMQAKIIIDHITKKLRGVQDQSVADSASELAFHAGVAEGKYKGLMAGLEPEVFDINKSLIRLNSDGRHEAVKRVEELTEIPRYQVPPKTVASTDGSETATDAPQPPPPSKDTAPPQEGAERPQEAE